MITGALIKIDLGQAYATEDLGQRYNWLTDECAPALAALLPQTTLKYLAIDDVPMSKRALNVLLSAVASSTYFNRAFVTVNPETSLFPRQRAFSKQATVSRMDSVSRHDPVLRTNIASGQIPN